MNVELSVWSGVVDIAVPVYATSELASDCRALERDEARLNVTVRYQACDDETCLLPRTETLHVDVPILPADVPSISMHMGHGQNELPFDGEPHMRRLVLRKL